MTASFAIQISLGRALALSFDSLLISDKLGQGTLAPGVPWVLALLSWRPYLGLEAFVTILEELENS